MTKCVSLNLRRSLFCISLWLVACSSTVQPDDAHDALPKSAVTNNPKAAEVNAQLGVSYLQQGQVERAKQKLLLATSQSPNSPVVWGSMAYFYAMTGNVNKADELYRKAISLNPKKGDSLNNYGVFLCSQNKYKQAIPYFKQAVTDPNYVTTGQAYENAGLCAKQIPDFATAEMFFTKALQNDPTLATSNLAMAQIMFSQEHYDKANLYEKRYHQLAAPTAESLWLEIRLANIAGDQNTVASDALLLKNQYPLSKEYQAFKTSGINV